MRARAMIFPLRISDIPGSRAISGSVISVIGMVTEGQPIWSISIWACSSESADEVL